MKDEFWIIIFWMCAAFFLTTVVWNININSIVAMKLGVKDSVTEVKK